MPLNIFHAIQNPLCRTKFTTDALGYSIISITFFPPTFIDLIQNKFGIPRIFIKDLIADDSGLNFAIKLEVRCEKNNLFLNSHWFPSIAFNFIGKIPTWYQKINSYSRDFRSRGPMWTSYCSFNREVLCAIFVIFGVTLYSCIQCWMVSRMLEWYWPSDDHYCLIVMKSRIFTHVRKWGICWKYCSRYWWYKIQPTSKIG